MTVRQLLACIDSAELTEWMAFERMEPFGALADECRIGAVAAAMFNVQRSKDSDRYFTPADFMPGLFRAIQSAEARRPRGDSLTPDQHAALIDASIFGMTKQ